MENKDFIKNCKVAAHSVLTAWANDIRCYETTGKKQFCLESSHNWGTAYCDWSYDRHQLFEALRKVGAINISGKVGFNYVKIYFDKRKRPIKE